MIDFNSALCSTCFYVLFTKDGDHVEFIHLTKDKLSYSTILGLASKYSSGFLYFGWSYSSEYRALTIRNGFVVDDVTLKSDGWLKFAVPIHESKE